MGNSDTLASAATPRRSMGWDATRRALRVQVWGAGGAVGRELVRALLLAGHPPERLRLFAREARRLAWRGQALPVEAAGARFESAELAFLCLPIEAGREWAPRLVGAGTRVIDLSGAFRLDPEVPLVAPGVGAPEVGAFTSLVALPEPATALIAPLLAALDRRARLARVHLTLLRSAACRGARGILALREELERGAEPGGSPHAPDRGAPIGPFDPCEGGLDVHGNGNAELVLASELRRVLGRPELAVGVGAVRVPSERVDGFVGDVDLERALPPEEANRALLHEGSFVLVAGEGPDVGCATGASSLQVGRLRAGSRGAGSLSFAAVGDRLRAGAALAALQVASSLPWA